MAANLSKDHFATHQGLSLPLERQSAFELRARSRARDQRMFRILILITSVFFLPVAVLRKLGNMNAQAGTENAPTILADAKAMASSIVPFIFMG